MDAATLSTLASLATICSLVLAGIFAYLKFWRTSARQSGNDMFDRAFRIIQNYETEATRKDREILSLQRQLGQLQQRMQQIEERNARLIQQLAIAYNVPPSFVEMRLDGTIPGRSYYPQQPPSRQGGQQPYGN